MHAQEYETTRLKFHVARSPVELTLHEHGEETTHFRIFFVGPGTSWQSYHRFPAGSWNIVFRCSVSQQVVANTSITVSGFKHMSIQVPLHGSELFLNVALKIVVHCSNHLNADRNQDRAFLRIVPKEPSEHVDPTTVCTHKGTPAEALQISAICADVGAVPLPLFDGKEWVLVVCNATGEMHKSMLGFSEFKIRTVREASAPNLSSIHCQYDESALPSKSHKELHNSWTTFGGGSSIESRMCKFRNLCMQYNSPTMYYIQDSEQVYPFKPSTQSVLLSSVQVQLDENLRGIPAWDRGVTWENSVGMWGPKTISASQWQRTQLQSQKSFNVPVFLFASYGTNNIAHLILDALFPIFSVVLDLLGVYSTDILLVYVAQTENIGHASVAYEMSKPKQSLLLSLLSKHQPLELSHLAQTIGEGKYRCFGTVLAGLGHRSHMQLRQNFTTFGSGFWQGFHEMLLHSTLQRIRSDPSYLHDEAHSAITMFVKGSSERRGLLNLDDLEEMLVEMQPAWGVTDVFVRADLSQVGLLDQLFWLSRTCILITYSGTLSFSSFMFLRTGSAHMLIPEYLGSQGLWFMRAEVYTDIDHLEFVWYGVNSTEVASGDENAHQPPLVLDPVRFMSSVEMAHHLHKGWIGQRVSARVAPNQQTLCQNRFLTEFDGSGGWEICGILAESANEAAIERLENRSLYA